MITNQRVLTSAGREEHCSVQQLLLLLEINSLCPIFYYRDIYGCDASVVILFIILFLEILFYFYLICFNESN